MQPSQGKQATHGADALLKAARPGNLLLAALGTTTGALAGGAPLGEGAHLVPLLAAAAVGAFGTAGGNLLNDLGDMELDKTAHPERPLPSGTITPRTTWLALLLLWTTAVALALLFDPRAGLLAAGLIALLVLYERRWKARGLLGNLLIGVAAGALFPLGALIVGVSLHAPLLLGALAGLAHLGRELLKDAQDATADAPTRRTLAVTHGPRTAARAALGVLLGAVLLSPLPVPLLGWPLLYLGLVSPAVALFLLAGITGLRDPARAQTLAKAAMVVALAAFLIAART